MGGISLKLTLVLVILLLGQWLALLELMAALGGPNEGYGPPPAACPFPPPMLPLLHPFIHFLIHATCNITVAVKGCSN